MTGKNAEILADSGLKLFLQDISMPMTSLLTPRPPEIQLPMWKPEVWLNTHFRTALSSSKMIP